MTRKAIRYPESTSDTIWIVDETVNGYWPEVGPLRLFREHFAILADLSNGPAPTREVKARAGIDPDGVGYGGILSKMMDWGLIQAREGRWEITEVGRSAVALRR